MAPHSWVLWALNLHTLVTQFHAGEAEQILHRITGEVPEQAGPGSPLAVVPRLTRQVRRATGNLATSPFWIGRAATMTFRTVRIRPPGHADWRPVRGGR
jgi:hypothetical protein